MSKKVLIDLFIARTGESMETAYRYLEENYWSFSASLTFYWVDKNEGNV